VVNEMALLQEIEMNNANAIALIETGALSTEKMLELCDKATDNYKDDPRRPAVVRAFVRNWKSANPLASYQNLIDIVTTATAPVQAHTVYTIASELSREDFEQCFQKLACEGDLIFAAGASGKYTQQEVFRLSQRLGYESRPRFWESVVNANILDSEGLYAVAMLGNQSWVEMQKLCLLVISKNALSAEQLMNVCEKYSSHKEEAMAAIATRLLSDDQIVSLFSGSWQRSLEWDEVVGYLRLEERTVSDLVTLGEKANSDKLWPSITKAINSKKAVRA
jgi:hypothetical protein